MTGVRFFLFFLLASLFELSRSRIDRNLREKRNLLYSPPLLYPFGGTIKMINSVYSILCNLTKENENKENTNVLRANVLSKMNPRLVSYVRYNPKLLLVNSHLYRAGYFIRNTNILVVGFAVPIELAGRILVYGQNFQFQYALPQNATFFSNLSQNRVFSRRRRDLDRYGRVLLFNTLEQYFQRNGLNGRECIKKSICEAVADPLINEGLIGELLHLLLTPEHAEDPSFPEDFLLAAKVAQKYEDCSRIFSSCPAGQGFLDRITRPF